MNTTQFIMQHKDIFIELNYLEKKIALKDLTNEASEIASHINQLAGKLAVHLTSEDRFLYPKLLIHSNEQVQVTAKTYMEQMGDLLQTFTVYKNDFNTRTKLIEHASRFPKETKLILQAIRTRMEKEELRLYPLL